MDPPVANILVVEDSRTQALRMRRFLEGFGYRPIQVSNGRLALEAMEQTLPDLVLTDMEMPELDGIELLRILKEDPARRDIPVLVLSSLQDTARAVACIERGADDYLAKPVDPVLLKARVESCLSRKMLRDREKDHMRLLEYERQRSERLLYNVLPRSIAERLKRTQAIIADQLADVSVLFADLVGFTTFSAVRSAEEVVHALSVLISTFDRLAEEHGVEKIKTLGDGWMGMAGLPGGRPDHAAATADLALAMNDHVTNWRTDDGTRFQLRLGIASGPAVAGVIGESKLSFDLWGDTVNLASRMESTGLAGAVQLCPRTHSHLEGLFGMEARGLVEIKGKGQIQTYLLGGRLARSAPAPEPSRRAASSAVLAELARDAVELATSLIDPATDCVTLRGLLPLAEKQLGIARRDKRAMLLLIAELSQTPSQETPGAVDPKVLRRMADTMRASFREIDVLGHLGAGRFVMLGLETSRTDPNVLVRQLSAAVERLPGSPFAVRACARRCMPQPDTAVENLVGLLVADLTGSAKALSPT